LNVLTTKVTEAHGGSLNSTVSLIVGSGLPIWLFWSQIL